MKLILTVDLEGDCGEKIAAQGSRDLASKLIEGLISQSENCVHIRGNITNLISQSENCGIRAYMVLYLYTLETIAFVLQ